MLNLLLCFNGVGGVLFSLVVFQFSCAFDLFAKSDRTATDCCVKNVSFLCLSGGFFSWIVAALWFYSFAIAKPQIWEKQKHKVESKGSYSIWYFSPNQKFLTILRWLVAKDPQFLVGKILITRLANITCASNLTNPRPFYWLPAICIRYKERKIAAKMRRPKMMNGHSVLPSTQSFGHPDFFLDYVLCPTPKWITDAPINLQDVKQCIAWSNCFIRSTLIWVFTVCSDIFVPIFSIITI